MKEFAIWYLTYGWIGMCVIGFAAGLTDNKRILLLFVLFSLIVGFSAIYFKHK